MDMSLHSDFNVGAACAEMVHDWPRRLDRRTAGGRQALWAGKSRLGVVLGPLLPSREFTKIFSKAFYRASETHKSRTRVVWSRPILATSVGIVGHEEIAANRKFASGSNAPSAMSMRIPKVDGR